MDSLNNTCTQIYENLHLYYSHIYIYIFYVQVIFVNSISNLRIMPLIYIFDCRKLPQAFQRIRVQPHLQRGKCSRRLHGLHSDQRKVGRSGYYSLGVASYFPYDIIGGRRPRERSKVCNEQILTVLGVTPHNGCAFCNLLRLWVMINCITQYQINIINHTYQN